jgi:hypothetical protein
MTFGPALALGIAADAEVVDVDIVLPGSARDMADLMGSGERTALAADLLARLQKVAPPGLVLRHARLVEPGEVRLGQLVAAADYEVTLDPEHLALLRAELPVRLAGPLEVTREIKGKKRKGKRRKGPPTRPTSRTIDVGAFLLHADLSGDRLAFRLRVAADGGVRPREVVEALLGERVPDHRFVRRGLLAVDAVDGADGGTLVPFATLGARRRPTAPPPANR